MYRSCHPSDTESATASILHYIIFKFMSGSALQTLTEELSQYTRQMKALDRQMTYKLSRTLLQVLMNLSGLDNEESSTCITGEALPEEGRDEADNEPLLWAAIITFGGILQTFFGDHVAAADDMVKYGANCVTTIFVASPTAVLDTYLKCVSCFAAARQTGHKKYITVGKKLRSKIKAWSKAGNPNVRHYECLVNAELMACEGKHDKAIKLYEEAIKISARCGCQQDAALACERLGDLYLNVLKSEDDASFRLGLARTYWLGWGAKAKVSQMDNMYSDLPGPVGSLFLSCEMNMSSALQPVSKHLTP
jgi:tetratricopeptide (TPR) repeat protein